MLLSHTGMVKSFSKLPYFALVIVFFLLSPALSFLGKTVSTRVYAAGDYTGVEQYSIDRDNAVLNGTVSLYPINTVANQGHMMDLVCSIHYFYGPTGCTNHSSVYRSMRNKTALDGLAMGMNAMFQYPAADLAYWVQNTGASLGFIAKPAYAQGIGFNGLLPLLPVWTAFRNIAYTILAFTMVIIGFMVMLRKKIDPKTVVTVQNSLPRIVIALILITFSYAIVGLMIDLMYLLIAFIAIVVGGALPDQSLTNTVLPIHYANPGFGALLLAVFGPLAKISPYTNMMSQFFQGDITAAVQNMINGMLFDNVLTMLIIAIAFLFAFVRLFFMLLSSYIQVLIAVLTGPIQILTDVFPGADGFTKWIKNLAANLVVFPITVFMLMIANAIASHIGTQTLWTAPMLPQVTQTAGGAVGGLGGLAEGLIALGIVLVIPNVAKGIKDSFKAEPLVSAGGPNVGGAWNTAMQGLSALYYVRMLKGDKTIPTALGVHPPASGEEGR